jgi:uncharacterized protein YyaL (SSP411 family)
MNRLAAEQSPYLLQHKNNPVDWWPWGEEAFSAAKDAGKPVFLSIGYSTCHWCHVMAHESFENQEIAKLMNESFININLDREERPEGDRLYMAFVQATSGGGGWPMSIWLTPEGRPFYGGTYFPPTDSYGRAGFANILKQIARLWRDDRERVETESKRILDALSAAGRSGPAVEFSADEAPLLLGFETFSRSFDESMVVSSGRPNSPALRLSISSCVSRSGQKERKRSAPGRWRFSRCRRWPPAGCAIILAEDFTATRSTNSGTFRISRKCSTTKPNCRSPSRKRGS